MPAPRTGLEPSLVEFVRSITVKTRNGQLAWQWFPDGITTSVDQETSVGFSASFAGARPIWRVFIVFDPQGREIRRVTPIAAAHQTELGIALEDLFFRVVGVR